MCTLVYLPLLPTYMFFTKYSLFCFVRLFFLFLVFVCLYLGLPPSPSHLCFFLIFFVSYFKVIFFLSLVFVCVCTLVYLLLLPIYFVHTILLIF